MVWVKRFFLLLAGFFLLPISVANANIKVGTVVFDPPYVSSIDQGFEIELVKLLCRRIKQQCDLIPMSFNVLFTALNKGKIDLAIDGIDFYVTANPLNDVFIYSYPYLLSNGQFLVATNSKFDTTVDLPNGSSVGLVKERQVAEMGIFFNYFIDKYGARLNAKLFNDLDTLLEALSEGRVAAAFLDDNEANYWLLNGGGEFKLLDKPMRVADGIGIMALPQNITLIQQLNQQLKNIEGDQEYSNLYNTYFGLGP